MAEQSKGFAGLLGNVFGTAPPAYMEGLLGKQATEDLRKRSIGTGIANALIGYAGMPKNQNLGLGRILAGAAQAGIGGAKGVYDNARNDYVQGQAIEQAKQKQEQMTAQRAAMEQAIAKYPQWKDAILANPALLAKIVEQEMTPPESPFAKLNPSDYTKESIAEYVNNGNDVTKLVTKKKDENLTQDRNAIAFANFNGKSFSELTPAEANQVNKYLENEKVRVAGAGVASETPEFKNAMTIRKEYTSLPEIKAFNEMKTAYQQIKTGLSAVSPAGDLAAATKFMKLLDPTSVVRESELNMAMQATGVLDRALDYKNKVLKGTKLTPAQRKDFLNVAEQLYNAAEATKNKIDVYYTDVAKSGNLNPSLIVKPSSANGLPAGVTVRVRSKQ